MDNETKHFEIFKITLSKNLQVFKGNDLDENTLTELTDKCVFETDTILNQYLFQTEMAEDNE
jgi:hypothetical protein